MAKSIYMRSLVAIACKLKLKCLARNARGKRRQRLYSHSSTRNAITGSGRCRKILKDCEHMTGHK